MVAYKRSMPNGKKQTTITFQPDPVAHKILIKAVNKRAGRGASKRGWRTRLINESVREHLKVEAA